MFVLFGFGHTKVKKTGETKPEQCSNCNNIKPFHIVERSKWFTLFFVPVFPYSKEKAIVCPVCNNTRLQGTVEDAGGEKLNEALNNKGEQLKEKEQNLKQLLDTGAIDLNEYKKKINLLKFEKGQ